VTNRWSQIRETLQVWDQRFLSLLRLERYVPDPAKHLYRLRAAGIGTADVGKLGPFAVVAFMGYIAHLVTNPGDIAITVQSMTGGPLPEERLGPVVSRVYASYTEAAGVLDQLEREIRTGAWL
jgi:hypothetical protein